MYPALANAELAVMELLWEAETLTSRAIREVLYADSPKAQHGTVQRLLQRLEDKGFVQRDKTSAVHRFRAMITRAAYGGSELERLAKKLAGGSVAPLLTNLIEENRLSPEELARLRKLLESESQGELTA